MLAIATISRESLLGRGSEKNRSASFAIIAVVEGAGNVRNGALVGVSEGISLAFVVVTVVRLSLLVLVGMRDGKSEGSIEKSSDGITDGEYSNAVVTTDDTSDGAMDGTKDGKSEGVIDKEKSEGLMDGTLVGF